LDSRALHGSHEALQAHCLIRPDQFFVNFDISTFLFLSFLSAKGSPKNNPPARTALAAPGYLFHCLSAYHRSASSALQQSNRLSQRQYQR
jgi:hypothetical protein